MFSPPTASVNGAKKGLRVFFFVPHAMGAADAFLAFIGIAIEEYRMDSFSLNGKVAERSGGYLYGEREW